LQEGWVIFLVREKIVSSGLHGAESLRLQTPGVGLPSLGARARPELLGFA